ncbi:MAG: septum formation protein Maf [Bacteroidales bacterium]|nr:septum formation protein Maf [Bacteroidales bacterium]
MLSGKKFILCSASPRRQHLIAGMGLDFVVDTGNTFTESVEDGVPFREIPVRMSEGKSLGFHRPLEEDEILITADTMVILSDEILGKPADRDDAVRMLHDISGRVHEVVTAVTLRDVRKMKTFTDSALVHFAPLTDEEIEFYVDKYKPFDKAGAYGIQEWIGYIGIEKVEGSFYNIAGLPSQKLWKELKEFI